MPSETHLIFQMLKDKPARLRFCNCQMLRGKCRLLFKQYLRYQYHHEEYILGFLQMLEKKNVTSNISLSLWFHLEFLLFRITRNAIVSSHLSEIIFASFFCYLFMIVSRLLFSTFRNKIGLCLLLLKCHFVFSPFLLFICSLLF